MSAKQEPGNWSPDGYREKTRQQPEGKREGETRIPYHNLTSTLHTILLREGFQEEPARICAETFAINSLEGVYSHGVNRFPKFVEYVRAGHIQPNSQAVKKHGAGVIEQWDGQSGPGPVNAYIASGRARDIAREHGMGCVALANTNHWLRGGTYAWQLAREGFAYIAWSNTIANMPPWGASDPRLGNNPLIIGVPHEEEAIVLDMALSQYSFGSLQVRRQRGEELPLPGGYDKDGNLTTDPAAIIASQRPLPIGYWKGAGLSLLLDILATLLSGGQSTAAISANQSEHSLSQVFIAIDLKCLHNYTAMGDTLRRIIDDYCGATPLRDGDSIRYPGQHVVATRTENLERGIPVFQEVWESVLKL